MDAQSAESTRNQKGKANYHQRLFKLHESREAGELELSYFHTIRYIRTIKFVCFYSKRNQYLIV